MAKLPNDQFQKKPLSPEEDRETFRKRLMADYEKANTETPYELRSLEEREKLDREFQEAWSTARAAVDAYPGDKEAIWKEIEQYLKDFRAKKKAKWEADKKISDT